jgi:hypothetical protein
MVTELRFGVKRPEAGVKSQLHIEISTFKSHPGLYFAEDTPHRIRLPSLGQRSLFFTLSRLAQGAGLPREVV